MNEQNKCKVPFFQQKYGTRTMMKIYSRVCGAVGNTARMQPREFACNRIFVRLVDKRLKEAGDKDEVYTFG